MDQSLYADQRREKAIQHVVAFARFTAIEFCRNLAEAGDILRAATERVAPLEKSAPKNKSGRHTAPEAKT